MKTAEQKKTIRKFKTEIKKFINKGISSGGICLKFEVKNIIQAEKAKTLESAIFVALYLKSLKIIDKYRETIKGIIEAKQKEEKKWLNS